MQQLLQDSASNGSNEIEAQERLLFGDSEGPDSDPNPAAGSENGTKGGKKGGKRAASPEAGPEPSRRVALKRGSGSSP